MPRTPANPADLVLRARLRETVHFPDLTERMALKLSAIPSYTARAHFGLWHRKLGSPDFRRFDGVFTPLVAVELDVTDVPIDPQHPLRVHGETYLARTVDAAGNTRHLVREGRHTVLDAQGAVVARAKLVNVFTRYDPDPAKRRVTKLPPGLGIGETPSRVTELPEIETLAPPGRAPDFVETGTRVWHYGQTDANRHVNGVEYLRVMEGFVADVLHGHGQDLRRGFFARARIVYRKPCFRGEGYRRAAWLRGEAPLVVAGVFRKDGEPPEARPAVAVELTLGLHEEAPGKEDGHGA
jgi:hypothetical protein